MCARTDLDNLLYDFSLDLARQWLDFHGFCLCASQETTAHYRVRALCESCRGDLECGCANCCFNATEFLDDALKDMHEELARTFHLAGMCITHQPLRERNYDR